MFVKVSQSEKQFIRATADLPQVLIYKLSGLVAKPRQ